MKGTYAHGDCAGMQCDGRIIKAIPLFFLNYFIYLNGRKTQRETVLLSTGLLPTWLRQLGLSQAGARKQEFLLDLPYGHRDPSRWAVLC